MLCAVIAIAAAWNHAPARSLLLASLLVLLLEFAIPVFLPAALASSAV